jgi:homopolymeric O-antigen transport system permease protein
VQERDFHLESKSARRPIVPTSPFVRVFEPRRGWFLPDWREIWASRALLAFLVWRDIKVRYKQTALGTSWAILQPLASMLVFTLFFGRFAGLAARTGGVPYPLYVYAGLLPWTFFASSVSRSSNSLLANPNLISKVYLPRLIIPAAVVVSGLLDTGVACTFLLALMAYYGVMPSWHLLLAPLFLLGTALAATGVGTLLSALTVSYRDFLHAVPFALQLWMFATPVIYPASIVPPRWQWIQTINPLAGLIEGFRAAFVMAPVDWPRSLGAMGISTTLFLAGAFCFRRAERRFADLI